MASQPKASPYTILQWNCRGIRNKKAEFSVWITQDPVPDIILLQEANLSPLTLRGYRVFNQPSIPPRYARQQTLPPPGFSHVFVKRSIPATQVPTSQLNTVTREITTVIVQLGSQPLSVSSVYWKPAPGDMDASWLAQIPNLTPHLCVIGGDFNAPHRAWSYAHDSARGSSTLQAAERVHLSLLNSPDRSTRYPLHAAQSPTTPDLTRLSQKLTGTWDVLADARGSDHFPIRIQLTALSRAKARSLVPVIQWDAFRAALEDLSRERPLFDRLQEARRAATRTLQLTDSTPVPEQHLLNLWAARQEAQDIYLTRGKTMPDRIRLNRATADSTEYANRLARENWQRHCESFDSHTGAGRVWCTFRGLSQRTRLRTAGEDLALSLRITAQEVADIAGTAFFPMNPPPSYDPSNITLNPSPPAMDDGMNSPFTKAELRAALLSTNTSSAPGPDGITYALLRNLPDNTLEELLAHFNQHLSLDNMEHSLYRIIVSGFASTALRPLSVWIEGEQRPLSSGKPVTLRCRSAGSRPPAVVEWWKAGVRMNATQANGTSALTFVPVSEDSGKQLSCRAENPLIAGSAIEDGWKLEVHYVPQLNLRLGSKLRHQHIQEGNDVFLECDIRASPWVTEIGWRFEGRDLATNTSAGLIVSNQSLVLQKVDRRARGRYTCTAANAEGIGESNPVNLRRSSSRAEGTRSAFEHHHLVLPAYFSELPPVC
ncbi:hypothetical protein HPB49_015462 [Dermacentor silvarum]|uniref:Uncharacterized protein n=1 Tax=Dermacentor silvarum TaxID=543639 RepID=A0ACB8CLR1_DERSI|nr:hypothetical protein HPB49_015462 [Dermacentor silvarum]